MPHLVLLGDSTLDNGRYVPGCPAIIEQIRGWFPKEWKATLLAKDGSITRQVIDQFKHLASDTSHLVISVGGNDMLENSFVVRESDKTLSEMWKEVDETRQQFHQDYRRLLREAFTHRLPMVCCTVYDAIQGITPPESILLSLFNDVIISECIQQGLPILDLRKVCTETRDFSKYSPIEPSEIGGAKIVRCLRHIFHSHDFAQPLTTIYGVGISQDNSRRNVPSRVVKINRILRDGIIPPIPFPQFCRLPLAFRRSRV